MAKATEAKHATIDVGLVVVPDDRHRRSVSESHIESLAESIGRIGLIHPIVITRDHTLLAGECRLRAHKRLGAKRIDVRYADDLTTTEHKCLELEENIKRSDLSWQDTCLAAAELHDLMREDNSDWDVDNTADMIGLKRSIVGEQIIVAREISKGNERVLAADGVRSAYNVIRRVRHRAMDVEMEQFQEAVRDEVALEDGDEGEDATVAKLRPASKDVYARDAALFWSKYKGPKFNFVHCDFPYGIGLDKSDQAGSAKHEGYADTPDTFWRLCRVMVDNLDKFTYKQAHIMFWFSMGAFDSTVNYNAVTGFFREAGLRVDPFPLVWHKTDNKGIIPDPERGGRRTYETALLMTRGDRRVVQPLAISYAAPTMRSESPHLSQKPEPVLRHFFRMLVDETTEMLDPTCGSGTALCAAESLGAKRVAGWDISETYVEDSCVALNRMRTLRAAEV